MERFQVFLLILSISFDVIYGDEDLSDILEAEVEDDQIWRVPQFDGTFKMMTEQEAKDITLRTEVRGRFKNITNLLFKDKRKKVQFFLHTQKNIIKWQEIDMERPETLHRSFFNKNHPTRIFAHGWLSGMPQMQSYEIIDSHLLNGRRENYNIIIVDWSVLGKTLNYYAARLRTRKAGLKVAQFIDWLHTEGGLDFETTHVYGHSLGAHVAGFTGKQVTKGRIKTIVGLDPAMPFFRTKNPQNRLADTDAEYVETIQTNGRELGFYHPIGQASFYPNGGLRQPGCGKDYLGGCAHIRAPTFLAEAIARGKHNSFDTVKCKDWTEMREKKCAGNSEGVRMGDPENYKKAKGNNDA
uniref:Lipase domain-containing protein n=1 Tax=Megaselia scalaris TaxID=36166 RepID=T1GPT2_MEGSC